MQESKKIHCPLCNDLVDRLVYRFHLENERVVIDKIREENPTWTEGDGICSRCVDYYHIQVLGQQGLLPNFGPYFQVKTVDDFVVIPTGLRLKTYPKFTGKGVTICFIDSDFFIHPDLVQQKNRIKALIDITRPRDADYFLRPRKSSWHGTMTSVVCAGDGHCSGGLYKGIASDAELVLLKVEDDNGKITTENIAKALSWVLDHHEEYGIRIVNISLGADVVVSYKASEVDQLAEKLVQNGINIVAAVGNDETGAIYPPANSLNVVAVGGTNDENDLLGDPSKLYHSTYGTTTDNLIKPDLLAPAAWIAAPILPGTPEQKEAEVLFKLMGLGEMQIRNELPHLIKDTQLNSSLSEANIDVVKAAIVKRMQETKYISPYYMHADGTSFAAPIVSSIVAQMLEADPGLQPHEVRQVLYSTCRRLLNFPAVRQGYGVINPRKALLKAIRRVPERMSASPVVDRKRKTIQFYVQNQCAEEISVAGSFNHWAKDVLLMEPYANGVWKLELPLLPDGRYTYKFLIDNRMWMEDVENPYREPDGFNGFNSLLIIEKEML